MWKTSLVVLAVLAAGCGGSANGGEPAPDFRGEVHAAYDAIPDTAAEGPTGHPVAAERAWEAFRSKVAAAPAPDALVSAKQQLLRDVGTLLADIEQSEDLIDYVEIGAATDRVDASLAAVRADIQGL